MRISTKGRYTLRMMIDLAEHYSDDLISLRDIAERQEISKKYLEQIIPLLNRAGFLYATRGALGGYHGFRHSIRSARSSKSPKATLHRYGALPTAEQAANEVQTARHYRFGRVLIRSSVII